MFVDAVLPQLNSDETDFVLGMIEMTETPTRQQACLLGELLYRCRLNPTQALLDLATRLLERGPAKLSKPRSTGTQHDRSARIEVES